MNINPHRFIKSKWIPGYFMFFYEIKITFNINNNFLNSRDTQRPRNAGQEIYAGRPRVGNDKRGLGFPRR